MDVICLQSRCRGASIDREAVEEAGAASARQILLTSRQTYTSEAKACLSFAPASKTKKRIAEEKIERLFSSLITDSMRLFGLF